MTAPSDRGNGGSAWSIGIDNHGGFIHNVNLYQQSPGDRPEDNLRRGIDLLNAGLPRQATRFLTAAYEGGVRSNKLWFFWALSMLSGRTEIDLSVEEFDQLTLCIDAAGSQGPDEWSGGMWTVRRLLELTFASRGGGFEQSELDAVLERIRALAPVARSAVRQHLDVIVSGRITHALWEEYRADVARIREAGDRGNRAQKFFVPDQAQPRRPHVPPHRPNPRNLAFIGGGLLAVIVFTGVLAGMLSAAGLGLLVLAVVGAGIAAFLCGQRVSIDAKRVRDRRIEYRGRSGDAVWAVAGSVQARFASQFKGMLDAAFHVHVPPGFFLEQWLAQTDDYRWSTAKNAVLLYCDGRTTPRELCWLAEHAARTQSELAQSGVLMNPRFGIQPDRGALGGVVAAGLAYVAAVLFVTGLAVSSGNIGFSAVPLAALFIGAGLALAVVGGVELAVGPRYHHEWVSRLNAEFSRAAWSQRSWTAWLADRPTDTEMADWLAADLSWFKIDAIEKHRLPFSDVIAHFAISEGAEVTQAARVRFGPVRYSYYNLRAFLLTENGVRTYKATLDFVNGTFDFPGTGNFQYDKIVSAGVEDVGARSGGFGRGAIPGARVAPVAHVLRLQLHEERMIIVVGNDRGRTLVDSADEDSRSLLRLELESSGAEHGLRILQAVAGEGKGWFETERARQREFFRQKRPERSGLIVGPSPRQAEIEGPESARP